MNSFDSAQEIDKARRRVRRLYGMGRLNIVQHNVGMLLLDVLVRAMTDKNYACRIQDNKEVLNGASE